MSERILYLVGITLEDRVKRQVEKKPTAELLEGLSEARDIMQDNSLTQVLDLIGLDPVLLHAFIAERVIRTRLYDLDWIVHSPLFNVTPKQTAIDELRTANLQSSLEILVSERNQIVEESYIDEEGLLRVRNLELAANDLIANASDFHVQDKQDPITQFKFSNELLDSWRLRWKNKFE